MSKYDKKVVFNYVNGNDIDNYNIDDLENDWEFMKEVTELTNDKKTYDLCDDKLKANLELVKFFITKFKDDNIFVLRVISNFLKLAKDELDILEIKILMSDFVDEEEKISNEFDKQVFYTVERIEYKRALLGEDQDTKDFLQMGFCYFYDTYSGRDTIISFIADKMIDEIFEIEKLSLEKLIHSKFKTKKDFDKIGITKFIIDYISNYDYALSNYVCAHIELIEQLKKDIESVVKNFDNYNKRKEKEIADRIIDYIYDFVEENNFYDCATNLLNRFISRDLKCKILLDDDDFDEKRSHEDYLFNISDEEYENYQKDVDFEGLEIVYKKNELKDEYYISKSDEFEYELIKNNIHYIKLKNDIEKILKTGEFYDEYNEPNKKENNNTKCRILKFEPKNDK